MKVGTGALNIIETELAIYLHLCLTQQFSKLGFGYVNWKATFYHCPFHTQNVDTVTFSTVSEYSLNTAQIETSSCYHYNWAAKSKILYF